MSSLDQLTTVYMYVLLYLIYVVDFIGGLKQVPTVMSTILLRFCLKPSCDQRQDSPSCTTTDTNYSPLCLLRLSDNNNRQLITESTPQFVHRDRAHRKPMLCLGPMVLKLRLGWEVYLKLVFTTVVNKDRLQYDFVSRETTQIKSLLIIDYFDNLLRYRKVYRKCLLT